MNDPIKRKLTTILAADAEGYSRQMETDEVGTVDALHRAREVFFKFIERRGGRVANTAGDGLIAEFPSVVEAVTCAIEVQRELSESRDTYPLRFRIGLHLGDVVVDGEDLLGEGVNLAARLQSMAEPGGILLSRQVYDQVHSKLTIGFEFLGERRPKNYQEDVEVYRVTPPAAPHGLRDILAIPEEVVHAAEDTLRRVAEADLDDEDKALRDTLIRTGSTLGVLWGVLFVIDISSGRGFFSHWTLLPILVYLGYQAAPLLGRSAGKLALTRLGVAVAGLFLINIFSWSGTLWVIYPAVIMIAVFALRKLRGAKD